MKFYRILGFVAIAIGITLAYINNGDNDHGLQFLFFLVMLWMIVEAIIEHQ